MVLRIFVLGFAQALRACSAGVANLNKVSLYIGEVALTRRFGSSLNELVHFLFCLVNGMFEGVQGSYLHADKPSNMADELTRRVSWGKKKLGL